MSIPYYNRICILLKDCRKNCDTSVTLYPLKNSDPNIIWCPIDNTKHGF